MKVRKISFLLIGVLLASQSQFDNTIYAASPEEQCFTELSKAAKRNPAFSDLNLDSVRKISGENGELKSEPFSVKTYADFSNAFSKPVPFFQSDLEYYPNRMNNVATKHRFTPKIHKSNRTNSGVIIYNNGYKTPIDYWMSKTGASAAADIKEYFSGQKTASQLDAKHNRQTIDGYYLNSEYVTFGRESDLTFSFPSRAANPADDGDYPSGRPIMDMRQYVMYTQHLKGGAMGNDLLSCEIIKMVPQSPYKLKDYDYSGDSIRWENYGGTKMSASNAKTRVVGDGKFRKAEIDYTITSRTDPGKQLLRFYVLSLNYNNNNSFLNTFRTVEMFNEAMRDAKNASQNFLEMRRAFYAKVLASGLGIGQDTSVYNSGDGNFPLASGHFCGLSFTKQAAPRFKCNGADPLRDACPTGYTKHQWADLSGIGAGKWTSCFTDSPQAVSSSGKNPGLFCGMRMENDAARVVLCNGVDPLDATCPTGFKASTFADMGANYKGKWTTCVKQNNNNGLSTTAGTMCGLKMEQQSAPVVSCGGMDPQTGCPEGYSSTQWANINASWGRWHSCIRN